MPESGEHNKIKTLISTSIVNWTGASLTEYNSSGHELDVFATTPDGISIYVEVIWSASRSNFYRDMNMVQQSDANVKVVVANPKIVNNKEFEREFSKIAISQRRIGFEMYGEIIDGDKILNVPDYLNTTFKELVLNAINKIRLHGKVAIEREAVLPPQPVVDKIPEYLSYILKEKKLFSFDNPRRASPFTQIITNDDFIEQTSESWRKDEAKKRDFIRLLNFALRPFCERRGLYYDNRHRRYMCLLFQGRDNVFRWRSRTRESIRRVARAIHSSDGTLLFYRHYTARLAFILIDNELFLKIEPSITLTSDGFQQLNRDKLVRFTTSGLRRQFNKQYLNYVRFWARYLSQRSLRLSIPAGEGVIEVDTIPAGTDTEVGIAGDRE